MSLDDMLDAFASLTEHSAVLVRTCWSNLPTAQPVGESPWFPHRAEILDGLAAASASSALLSLMINRFRLFLRRDATKYDAEGLPIFDEGAYTTEQLTIFELKGLYLHDYPKDHFDDDDEGWERERTRIRNMYRQKTIPEADLECLCSDPDPTARYPLFDNLEAALLKALNPGQMQDAPRTRKTFVAVPTQSATISDVAEFVYQLYRVGDAIAEADAEDYFLHHALYAHNLQRLEHLLLECGLRTGLSWPAMGKCMGDSKGMSDSKGQVGISGTAAKKRYKGPWEPDHIANFGHRLFVQHIRDLTSYAKTGRGYVWWDEVWGEGPWDK